MKQFMWLRLNPHSPFFCFLFRLRADPHRRRTNWHSFRIEQTNCHWNAWQIAQFIQDEFQFVSDVDTPLAIPDRCFEGHMDTGTGYRGIKGQLHLIVFQCVAWMSTLWCIQSKLFFSTTKVHRSLLFFSLIPAKDPAMRLTQCLVILQITGWAIIGESWWPWRRFPRVGRPGRITDWFWFLMVWHWAWLGSCVRQHWNFLHWGFVFWKATPQWIQNKSSAILNHCTSPEACLWVQQKICKETLCSGLVNQTKLYFWTTFQAGMSHQKLHQLSTCFQFCAPVHNRQHCYLPLTASNTT